MAGTPVRLAGLAALAALAAAAVALWPAPRDERPTPLDVGETPKRTGRGDAPRAATPGAKVLPPKEAFATREEAGLLASALEKIDMGIGAPLPPAAGEAPLDWERVRSAILAFPGVYLRWESEEVRKEVMATQFRHLIPEVPAGAPKEGLVGWGPLGAELMNAGFRFWMGPPVIWIGRGK